METEVHRRRHSIVASCPSDSESEPEVVKPCVRKAFQARVQRLLLVKWFAKTPGVRISHLRKVSSTFEPPTPEEEALLGKVLSNGHVMQQATDLLQSFQREVCGVDGFFDELGVEPCRVGEPFLSSEKKENLMKLAVKALHQAKWLSLRICYNDYMRQQEQELQLLKQSYGKLKEQFADVRQDYLTEVAALRDQVRLRGAVDTAGWVETSDGGDVVYFFDPGKALTPKEAHFVLLAVKEKLMMILEQNPRLGGAVDLGQLERLRELKENREISELHGELLRRSQELKEAQRLVRRMQEEEAPAAGPKSKWDVIVRELEDKVSQLRRDVVTLKQQLRAENKERQHLERQLGAVRLEREELQQCARELEEQEQVCRAEASGLRQELEAARAQSRVLQGSERAAKAKLEALQETCEQLRKMLLRRKPVGQLSEESVLLDLDLLPSVVSSEGLEKAQEELLTALEEKDVQVFRAEDLRRENSELRRELAKQSQGLLVLEAQQCCRGQGELRSFLRSLQEQLGVSERSPLQFPELEHELAEASEEAAEALKALLAGLHSREARGRQTEELQKLHEESVECQERRRRLERELFERRLKELKVGKEQGMLQASLQMLESMSEDMQQLSSENATLRESLLSFSTSLSEASSVAADVEGDEALRDILTSIKTNATCAVPAVFSRLFNDSRKSSSRLEREEQGRRESLMKSLIVHLEERSEDPKGLSMTKIPTGDARRLKQRSSMEHLEEVAKPRGLVKHQSTEQLEDFKEQSVRRQMLQIQPPEAFQEKMGRESSRHGRRPLGRVPKRSLVQTSRQDSSLSLRVCESEGQAEDFPFEMQGSTWSRQCSGESEASLASKPSSRSMGTTLGITSMEFPDIQAGKVRNGRARLPQVSQASRHVHADAEPCASGESSDIHSDGDFEDDKHLPKWGGQTQRESRDRLEVPASWQNRLRGLTSRRLSSVVGRPELPRSRRASLS